MVDDLFQFAKYPSTSRVVLGTHYVFQCPDFSSFSSLSVVPLDMAINPAANLQPHQHHFFTSPATPAPFFTSPATPAPFFYISSHISTIFLYKLYILQAREVRFGDLFSFKRFFFFFCNFFSLNSNLCPYYHRFIRNPYKHCIFFTFFTVNFDRELLLLPSRLMRCPCQIESQHESPATSMSNWITIRDGHG